MKQFQFTSLAICLLLALIGCAGQQQASQQANNYPQVTIIEGKTSKSEIIAALGMPHKMDSGLAAMGKSLFQSAMGKDISDDCMASGISYDFGSTSVTPQPGQAAKLTLIQKDGTELSVNLGRGTPNSGFDLYRMLDVYFDSKGITCVVMINK